MKSGHFVIQANEIYNREDCFNPLEIGSFCNSSHYSLQFLKSVSIPLKSGHFVIRLLEEKEVKIGCFNPLEIGSFCNNGIYTIKDFENLFQSP